MCCRVCHFHFFWVGMTLGPERTMQTIFCGIFCRKLSFEYFTFLQKVASAIYKKSDTFQFCMQLRLVYLRTNVKEATFSGALMRAFCALNRQRIQVSSCLCYISESTVTERLLVVKTWMCTEKQTTDSLLWSARKSYLFTVAVIFRIGMVRIELLANCKGEILFLSQMIDFQWWVLCPVCIR